MIKLTQVDYVVICIYLILIILYGLFKSRKQDTSNYFLAGRNMTWPIVGISLFAANIGSNTIIGITAEAFQAHTAVFNYEWMACIVLVIFAIFFLPFYLKSKVYTLPEFLEKRYDIRSRYYFSAITIIGNIIIDTASGLYAGGILIKLILPDVDTWVIIAALAAASAIYTIPGGLTAVVHTEIVQAALLIAGSIVLTYYSMDLVGGMEGLKEGLDQLHDNQFITKSSDDVFQLIEPLDSDYMPWTTLVFSLPILGFYYFVNNQFMAQRVLGAKNLNHGRWGALFTGFLKLPIFYFMVIPGIAAIVIFKGENPLINFNITEFQYYIEKDGVKEICSQLEDCPNLTYPALIYNLLPKGILGLIIAGILAAMSSSISATLNAASTLITMDFVATFRPNSTNKFLVRSGQITTTLFVFLAALWAPFIENFGSIWDYLQQVLSVIAPPVVAVFIVGLFWKRANGNGAIVSLVGGSLIGLIIVLMRLTDIFGISLDIHFLNAVPLLMIISAATNIIVSLITESEGNDQKDISHMIYSKQIYDNETLELKSVKWYQNYRFLSLILLILTVITVLWISF